MCTQAFMRQLHFKFETRLQTTFFLAAGKGSDLSPFPSRENCAIECKRDWGKLLRTRLSQRGKRLKFQPSKEISKVRMKNPQETGEPTRRCSDGAAPLE
jgi:hypothetical protein